MTMVLLGVSFLVLGPVGHGLTDGVGTLLEPAPDPERLLVPLLSGVFLLVSIVVSLNALSISQERTPMGSQRREHRDVARFREDVEALVGEPVSLAEPARLLRLLAGAVVRELQALDRLVGDGSAAPEVTEYLAATAASTAAMVERLDATTGVRGAVLATVHYGYGEQTAGLRRLRAEHGDTLPAAADETVDRLLEALELFATAQGYLRRRYFRTAFARLSTRLVAVSLAAILLLLFVILHTGTTLTRHLWVTVVQTVALAPFAVLAAHVLRTAAVVRHTRPHGGVATDPGGPHGDND